MADVRPGNEFASWMSIQPSEIGQAVKSGLMAYGMQKSGLTDWLNNLNKKQTNIPGSVAPFTGISEQGQLPVVPQAPQNMDWGAMSPNAPVVPGASIPSTTPTAPAAPAMPNPQELGMDWLNGKLSKLTTMAAPILG